MNAIQRFAKIIEFRWKYCCDMPDWRIVLEWSPGPDREPILWKRRVRAVLFGYGEGWTLKDTIINVISLGNLP